MNENNPELSDNKTGRTRNKNRTHIPASGYDLEELRALPIIDLIKIALNLSIENPNDLPTVIAQLVRSEL